MFRNPVIAAWLGLVLLLVTGAARALPLHQVEMPPGFSISIFAEVPNARSLTLSNNGVVFVGNRSGDSVWGVQDSDGDGRAETRWRVLEGLDMPNGVAWQEVDGRGWLYIAENERIIRVAESEAMRRDGAERFGLVRDDLPDATHHGWRYIGFGPDGRLYLSIGVPCNVCAEDPKFGKIFSMQADGSDQRVHAQGVRNSVGLDFDPATGDLWFTDNGRDWLGDNRPSDELNHVTGAGQDFGFPYCHAGDLQDPEFGRGVDCSRYRAPVVELGPHVAALGMRFYTGSMFPEQYRGGMFIAEHGSWNRSEKIGYRVKFVQKTPDGARQEVFASGWLRGDNAWGRPVDVLVMPDGALLVSDDDAGMIYRISYTGAAADAAAMAGKY